MKSWVFIAILAFVGTVLAASQFEPSLKMETFHSVPAMYRNGTPVSASDEINVDTVANFNFETGLQGWTVTNFTDSLPNFHKDRRNALGNTGRSWNAGDTVHFPNGGYFDEHMEHLVSPVLNLSGLSNPVLSFQINQNSEPPEGVDIPGYDGWDASNVWYSIDSGLTWSVLPITQTSGATGFLYNVTSSYAFGYSFGMGTGIGGWGGNSVGWHSVSVPIPTAARVANFRFRFTFASDPGACTADTTTANHAWFGLCVDSIRVTNGATVLLDNNGDNVAIPADFTPVNGAVSQTVFHVATDDSAGHSPTHCVMIEENHDGPYCALTSPPIFLPSGSRHYWQYNVFCDLMDSVINDPNIPGSENSLRHYYRVQIKDTHPDSGWTYQHHDYRRSYYGGERWHTYVAGDPFPTNNTSPNDQMDLTPWSGDTIQIRFIVYGDFHNGDQGTGMHLDDIFFYSSNQPDHEVGLAKMFLPYPTTVGFLTRGSIHMLNNGRMPETDVGFYWRRNRAMFPAITVPALRINLDTVITLRTGSTGRNALGWTPTAAGNFMVDAYLAGVTDDTTHGNDSTSFYNSQLLIHDSVTVRATNTYELGYDSRRFTHAWNITSTNYPIVRFTPMSDSITSTLTITAVRMQFNGRPEIPVGETRSATIKVYEDLNGQPGAVIRTQDIAVPRDSTLSNWYTCTLTDPIVNHWGNFYVSIERSSTTDTLMIVGHNFDEPYIRSHSYHYTGIALTDSNIMAFRIHVLTTRGTDVKEIVTATMPGNFALYDAYPNPFNPTTEIKFAVPYRAKVSVALFNMMGQQVTKLAEGEMKAGTYTATVNGTRLSSGVYFVRMHAGSFNAARKIVLVK